MIRLSHRVNGAARALAVPGWAELDATLRGRRVRHAAYAGEGAPLLLVHGIGPGTTGEANFAPLIAALDPAWPVHLIDLAGFGGSVGAADGFDTELWLEQINGALNRIGEPAVLVGNSVGGALALKAAARRPDLAGVVAIAAAAAAAPATEELKAFWRTPDSPGALAEAMRPMTATRTEPPEGLVMARWAAFADPVYAAWFGPALADADRHLAAVAVSPEEARRIAIPVHVLHGRHDRACPAASLAAFVLERLPQADFSLLAGCGHNVISERTDAVLAAVGQIRSKGSAQ